MTGWPQNEKWLSFSYAVHPEHRAAPPWLGFPKDKKTLEGDIRPQAPTFRARWTLKTFQFTFVKAKDQWPRTTKQIAAKFGAQQPNHCRPSMSLLDN